MWRYVGGKIYRADGGFQSQNIWHVISACVRWSPCVYCIQRLAQLGGSEVVSRAENKGTRPEYLRQLDDSCSAPSTLRLKVGAQVRAGLMVVVVIIIREKI